MNCRDVQSSRAAHDAGTLSPAEAAAWVEHVHRCERCSEGLRDFEALLGELPEEPFDLEESIMQEILERSATANRKRSVAAKRTPWFALFLRPAFGAGVCAGLVMLFLLSTFLRGPRRAGGPGRGSFGRGPILPDPGRLPSRPPRGGGRGQRQARGGRRSRCRVHRPPRRRSRGDRRDDPRSPRTRRGRSGPAPPSRLHRPSRSARPEAGGRPTSICVARGGSSRSPRPSSSARSGAPPSPSPTTTRRDPWSLSPRAPAG